jgi:protoheme IX farnesyltransferase
MPQPAPESAVLSAASLPAPLAVQPGALAFARDLLALAKPRLSALVLFTTAGGIFLAPGTLGWPRALVTLVMTTFAVGAANALNCYLERESDGLMKRTRTRPLPAGRLDARVALAFGLVLATVSVPTLGLVVNPLAGALAALAIVSYVAVYTPMKQRSQHAVYVGALPGAIPPLLGWAAVTGRLDLAGLALFAVMFIWQIPHFLAIALYLREDYKRAGIKVVPLVAGDESARFQIVLSTLLLVPVTFSLEALGLAGKGYLVAAVALGCGFFAWAATGLVGTPGPRWARGLMLASIAYLTLLFLALGVDAR